jgi:TPR repeat protein
MKYLFLFLLVFTSGAAVATEPGSQYQQQAEAGDRRAQYYLADTWVSSGDYQKAEYWAQKAAAQGDGDALALLAQLKIRNPQQADYPQARQLAEKAVEAGSKSGEIVLARVLVNRQAGATDVAHAITLLQDAARDSESDAAVDAQMLLGLIYASGVHGPEDDVKASEYFKGSSSLSRTGYAEYWAGMMSSRERKALSNRISRRRCTGSTSVAWRGLIPAAKSLTGLVKDKKKPGAIAPGFVFYWAVLSNLPSTSRS